MDKGTKIKFCTVIGAFLEIGKESSFVAKRSHILNNMMTKMTFQELHEFSKNCNKLKIEFKNYKWFLLLKLYKGKVSPQT